MSISPSLQLLISQIAKGDNIDPDLVSAIVLQESGGNPWLTRFEPEWHYFNDPAFHSKQCWVTIETEHVMQAMSWGPMQVMGAVARDLGWGAELTRLSQAQIGLLYGCMKLAQCLEKNPILNDAIAAYNAGSAKKNADGTYVNQAYVDSVLKHLAMIRGEP